MRSIGWWIMVSAGALAGCPSEEEPKGGRDNVDMLAPTEGTWDVALDFVDNGCNIDRETSGYPAELALDGDAGTLVDDDGTTWDCALADGVLDCVTEQVQEETAVDLQLKFSAEQRWTFTADDAADVTLAFQLDCEGADCAAFEAELGATLPCTSTSEGTATLAD